MSVQSRLIGALIELPASGEVVATTIVDLLGNRTRLVFADIEVNQAPPEETFRFDPPPGVEVIDMMSPR